MNILIAIDSSPTAQAALAATLARSGPHARNFESSQSCRAKDGQVNRI